MKLEEYGAWINFWHTYSSDVLKVPVPIFLQKLSSFEPSEILSADLLINGEYHLYASVFIQRHEHEAPFTVSFQSLKTHNFIYESSWEGLVLKLTALYKEVQSEN